METGMGTPPVHIDQVAELLTEVGIPAAWFNHLWSCPSLLDGSRHKGRASDDKSRERLLRNAGVKYVDRLDVRDSTQKQEVEKFVTTDFLKHLAG
jgi:hypothetical protein